MPQTVQTPGVEVEQSGSSRSDLEQSGPSSACNEMVVACNNPEVAPKPGNARSTAQSIAAVKRKRGKKGQQRSDVWDHFTKVDHPLIETVDGVEKVVGNTKRAQCKYCLTHLACNPYDNGTSSLRKRIETVCKGYPGRVKVESGQQVLTSDGKRGQGSLVSVNWSQDNYIEAATHMIVVDELPFRFIEKPGFNYFCSVVVPLFKVPCRKVIMKNFLRMYDAKKEELRRELKGWQMHKRVLAFCVVPNHQGIMIGKLLESCLLDWSIDKVLTVSVDNAFANKNAIDYLRKKMCSWEIKQIYGGKFMHVICLAHIVNLIVRSSLKLMERSVACIRNAVRYVRSSGSRLDEFEKCVEKEKVECNRIYILDVSTRWNSTFLMLDTTLELKKAFERLYDDDERFRNYFDEDEEIAEDEAEAASRRRVPTKRVGPPTETDWENAGIFVKFLKDFYDVTLTVSASLTPTAHKTFHDIVTIEAELEELSSLGIGPDPNEADIVLYDMAVQMKSKYDKYFASLDDMNQLFLVAVVLDPRYKLRNIGRVCEVWLNLPDDVIKKKIGGSEATCYRTL
ncbi:zinc finger BED domain-containing protein RICESLEEPER 1-like [Rosa chinensis]|uniref:zinc finger BED domain-containing protein RICESLEEPER 1-like n=1 Tax=Rosa chinensis TaxID=74649 RepID=UPI001AD8D0FE|nr:zinc finger BED domain-containing protein RICESLEEPER 1-like [Rosa chinensis]